MLEMPPEDAPRPARATIPPTTAATMPLRISPAPSAASQPKTTLVQLVPSLLSLYLRSSSCSRRASPTQRVPDSARPSPERTSFSSALGASVLLSPLVLSLIFRLLFVNLLQRFCY